MHPRRSLVWLVLAVALFLGACFLLFLPLSAAPSKHPPDTPEIIETTTAIATPTSSPTETGTPTETSTFTPTATNTPLPSPTPTSTTGALAAPSSTHMPARIQIYVNEFLPQPASDWNGDGAANTDDEWIEM